MRAYLEPSDKSQSGRNRVRTAVAAITLTLVLAGVIMAWRSHQRHVHEHEIAAMAAEPSRLSQAVASGAITAQERDAALREQGQQAMRGAVDGYFALPPGKTREAYLDRVLERYQQVRRQREAQSGRPEPNLVPPAAPAQEQLNALENIPPAEKARVAEFIAALSNRMHQRGISITAAK